MKRAASSPPPPARRRPRHRLRLLCALGAAAAAVLGHHCLSGGESASLPAAVPSLAQRGAAGDGRAPKPGAAAAVDAWLETLRALEGERAAGAGDAPVISLSSYPSPAREAAFQKLLARLSADNAAETHRLLSGNAAGDSTVLTEVEWSAILEKWGQLDGAPAVDLLAGQEDSLREKVPALLRGWARADPPAAAAWLREREERERENAAADVQGDAPVTPADGDWRIAACRELVLGWMETDPDAAARWLNESPPGPARDAAAGAFAAGAAGLDPEGALAWALSIADVSWRACALETVGRHWLRTDPEAALAALREAGCPPETISAMRTAREPGIDLLQAAGAAALSGQGGGEAGIFISGTP